MRYLFLCEHCPGTDKVDGKHAGVLHEREISIKKAPPLGAKKQCPKCKQRTAKRILSTGIGGIVRGSAEFDWKPGEAVRTCINGQEMRFEFVDHPHTDPKLQRDLSMMAKKHGVKHGLGKTRFCEKAGRLVVDVASNVPDPLGRMQRQLNEAKRRGEYQQTTRAVNTPVKRRGNFKSPIPVGEATRRAQAKREAKAMKG